MIILYIIGGLIASLLLLALVVPREISAKREILINKPVSEVFDFIKYLKNQQLYSKWATLDPDMKNTFSGTDAQPGFVNHWSGNKKVGEGEQEILAITEGKSLVTELRFIKPFQSLAKAEMTTEAVDASHTRVTWGFESKMNYPMNIIKLFMNMSEMVGKDFAIGLQNLKVLLEK